MANHESRPQVESVDLFLAFARKKDGVPNTKCIRTIIRDYNLDLSILEAKLKVIGGTWRIHKTINSRDTEKARIWLIKKLLDNPEFAGCIDSLWRTALLQPENAYTNWWLLDIDTQDVTKIDEVESLIGRWRGIIKKEIKTPNGWHFIVNPFDSRKVCELSYISLIRDGYEFIKIVKEE